MFFPSSHTLIDLASHDILSNKYGRTKKKERTHITTHFFRNKNPGKKIKC